ncbi:MAG: insulinase family protein [Deltaproteobacteria bacterium]|nr:insulinase family protein [Deltaproteobacteria bacterium]
MEKMLKPEAWHPEIDIKQYRFDNGLTLLVLPEHGLPIVSFQVHYAVGSRNERPGITGISHLFEHMMFRGSKELGPEEFSQVIQAKGGEVNAFTTSDNTSYFENLPAAHLELAVRLEAERLVHLRLTQDNFATEREVVRSERKLRAVDSPLGLPLELLSAMAYTQHPYQWPILGWDYDLRNLTLEDCLDFHRTYYNPANLVAVVSGDVDSQQAQDLVAKYFGPIPSPGVPPPIRAQEPPQRGERRAIYKKVSQVEAFLAGFHVPGLKDPEIYAVLLLAAILGEGKASRGYQRFVRPGKAIDLEVHLPPPPFAYQDPGLLVIIGLAAPGQPLATLEEEVWDEIAQIQDQGVTPEELNRVKKMMRAQYVKVLANNFYRGVLAALLYLKTGEAGLVNRIPDLYDQVSPDDIQAAARRYLNEDNRTVVMLKPVSEAENAALGPVA